MTSSLAAQLANVRSLNAERLTSSASLVKHTSYLFPPKTAEQQDLFTVHALGSSGWTEMSSQDSTLLRWNNANLLFGEQSRSTDRLMLPKEDNEAIDTAVREFLHLAGPVLLSKAASKCLEWLVRRFRIHEFSVQDLLAAFLPYHDTQQFARMLAICKIDNLAHLQFLLSIKRSGQPLPAGVLHAALLAPASTTASLDLLRWIANLVSNDVSTQLGVQPHRALVNFWTSTLVQVCAARSHLDDRQHVAGLSKSTSNSKRSVKARAADAQTVLTVLLPAAVRVAGTAAYGQDAQVGGFMLLCTIAQSFPLSKEAVQGIFTSLAKLLAADALAAGPVLCRALVSSAIALCASPETVPSPLTMSSVAADRLIPNSLASLIVATPDASKSIPVLAKTYDSHAFLEQLLATLLARLPDDDSLQLLSTLLRARWLAAETLVQTLELVFCLRLDGKAAADTFEAGASFGKNQVQRQHAVQNRIQLLSAVRSERSESFDQALRTCTDKNRSTDQIEAVWRTMQAVLAVESGTSLEDAASGKLEGSTNILWLSIHSADASQRALALRQLYADVTNGRASAQDNMVQDALRSRIPDSSSDVLEALYSQPEALLEVFDARTLLDMVVEALTTQDNSADLVAQHLKFLLTEYLAQNEAEVDAVARRAVWPFLFQTERNAAAAKTVAQLLVQLKPEGVLSAVVGALDTSNENEDEDGHAAARNDAVAGAVAQHVAKATGDAKTQWTQFLVSRAHSGTVDALVTDETASLVLIHLAALLEGVEYAKLANTLVQRVVVPTFSTAAAPEEAELFTELSLQQILSASPHAAVLPHFYEHAGTLQSARLMASFLLIQLVRQAEVPDFGMLLAVKVTNQDEQSRKLLSSLYSIVNVSPLAAPLSKLLLQALLVRLGESVLPFLAAIWTDRRRQSKAVRLAAARHAGAYLRAHATSPQAEPRDFQVVVPALLVALGDEEPAVRMAAVTALECVLETARNAVSALAASSSSSKKKATEEADIFGFDVIYGEKASSDLQYVDLEALVFYLTQLLERKSGFRGDAAFLPRLHGDVLNVTRNDARKEIAHKHSVVCFLLSHLLCWHAVPIRLVLLQSLEAVHDASKLKMLLPLVQSVAGGNLASETESLPTAQDRETFLELLFSTYDATSRSTVEEPSTGAWSTLLDSLASPAQSRESLAVQKAALQSLRTAGLFSQLHQAMRQELYLHLATVIADPATPATPELAAALRELEVDAAVLVPVLSGLRDGITAKALDAPEAKRARTSLGTDEQFGRTCATLVAVLEAAVGRKLVRSSALVYELFEVLRVAVELHSGLLTPNAEQMLQLAMSCISNLLEGLPKPDGSVPADIVQSLRADTIVNAIKTSNNPQTFQHALLLLSRIANIAPEAVLHNVMPIFTFVGSTVLQRDDAFSFSVVENVLKSIVPALVASLKTSRHSAKAGTEATDEMSGDDKFALLCEARGFIRIFTDAATHVPRHRRQMFFRLLVDILGASDFSAAVAMLLVDRSAHKIVKQPRSDAEQTLQLPLAVVAPHSASIQLSALNEIWAELLRIWAHREETEMLSDEVFLDRAGSLDKEHIDLQSEPIRQIQALLLFVRQVLVSSTFADRIARLSPAKLGSKWESFLGSALELADLARASHPEIGALAVEALEAAMPHVPVDNVMRVVSTLVHDGDSKQSRTQSTARKTSGFSLFASRVAIMPADSAERSVVANFTPALLKAVTDVVLASLAGKTGKGNDDVNALRQSALDAIKIVANSAQASEHTALAAAIPVLVKLGKAGAKADVEAAVSNVTVPISARISVFSIARRLAGKLGPRLIPHVASLVPFCLSVVSDSAKRVSVADSDSEDSDDSDDDDDVDMEAVKGGAVNTNSASLRTGALDTIACLFGSVPTFMASYVGQIISLSVSPELKSAMASANGSSTASERSLNLVLSALIRKTPANDVFESSFKIWDATLAELVSQKSSDGDDSEDEDEEEEQHSVEKLVGIAEFLARALRQTDREAISKAYKGVYRFLLRALDVRRVRAWQLSSATLAKIEDSLINSTFIRLVMKLNEATFRPLFLRMFDWAVLDLVDDDEGSVAEQHGILARQVVLFKTFNALSETLRSLVSTYYGTLLDQVVELLDQFVKPSASLTAKDVALLGSLQHELWVQVLQSLRSSATHDEGVFWNPTRVSKLAPALFSQFALLPSSSSASARSTLFKVPATEFDALLSPLVVALLRNVNDESTLKLFNSSLLSKASSSRVANTKAIRLSATKLIAEMWRSQQEQLLALVPETIAQLSELLDDDDQDIVIHANEFRKHIEAVLGESIETYLT